MGRKTKALAALMLSAVLAFGALCATASANGRDGPAMDAFDAVAEESAQKEPGTLSARGDSALALTGVYGEGSDGTGGEDRNPVDTGMFPDGGVLVMPVPDGEVSDGTDTAVIQPVGHFSDVDESNPYFDRLNTAYEIGLVVGTGGGKFSPDGILTGKQIQILIGRAWPEVNAKDVTERVFVDLGHSDTKATYKDMCAVFFDAAGYKPVDARLWTMGVKYDRTLNAFYAAKGLGLLPSDTDMKAFVRRDQAVALLVDLIQNEYEMPLPDYMKGVNFEEEVPGQYIPAMYDFKYIPASIREDFNARGWKIVLGNSYLAEYNRTHNTPDGYPAIALTSFAEKTLFIGDARSNSVLHELGHYVDYVSKYKHSQYKTDAFAFDGKTVGKNISRYGGTNPDEMFAECFEYYMRHHDDAKAVEKLKKNAPYTWGTLALLEANGWICDFEELTRVPDEVQEAA